jgi:hypothetical protein
MHPATRTFRAARRAALALLLTVPAARAEAQGDCATGTLASYLTQGFSCRIGGWTFLNFESRGDHVVINGAEVLPVDPGATILTPFVGTDASGRTTFGFDLAGFVTAAGAHGTTQGFESSDVFATLDFLLVGATPQLRVVDTRVAGETDGFNETPAILRTESFLGGNVQEASGPGFCLGEFPTTGPLPGAVAIGGPCSGPLGGELVVNLAISSTASREGVSAVPVDGFSLVSISRVQFTQAVVPEPATVTLVAGGVLALAGWRGGAGRAPDPRLSS